MTKLTQAEKCIILFALGAEVGRQVGGKLPELDIENNPVHILAMKLCNHDVYVETPKEKEGL